MTIESRQLFLKNQRTKELNRWFGRYEITKPVTFKVERVYAIINHYTCGRNYGKFHCDEKDIELEF